MSQFPSDSYRLGAANRDLEEEALGWVVRLTSGDVSQEEEREFALWHDDADNARAYGRARRLWLGLGPILEEQEAAGWPGASEERTAEPSARPRFKGLSRFAAMAASLALVTVASVEYVHVWQFDHVSGSNVSSRLSLADGSTVTLGPDSALNTDFSNGGRHVSLARGEAYFDVTHDPAHPFVVSSGRGVVKVLGTAFSVRHRDDGDVTVTVERGRVQVTSGASSDILTPDRQITFGLSGLGRIQAVDANLSLAWMRGRLIMENKPLREVLSELDRYERGEIVLLNDEAAQRRINAVIDLQRTDSWLTALASSQGLKLTRVGPLKILR